MIRAYIVHHDVGFAPNPFYGVCTLATCKPKIRAHADRGDWVVGIGSGNDGVRGKLIYAMRLDERITIDEYWEDPRFFLKRPTFQGSLKQAQGDNAYHRDENGVWIQERCRHTHSNPNQTQKHITRDTSENWVLVSRHFVYLGANAIDIPRQIQDRFGAHLSLDGSNTPKRKPRRSKNFNDEEMMRLFLDWLNGLNMWGCKGDPVEWIKDDKIRGFLAKCSQ